MRSWKTHLTIPNNEQKKVRIQMDQYKLPENITLKELEQEHNNTAFLVVVKNYQIKCLQDELAVLYPKMLLLNEKGAELQKLEKEKEPEKVVEGEVIV
jgi:hypothetical protein